MLGILYFGLRLHLVIRAGEYLFILCLCSCISHTTSFSKLSLLTSVSPYIPPIYHTTGLPDRRDSCFLSTDRKASNKIVTFVRWHARSKLPKRIMTHSTIVLFLFDVCGQLFHSKQNHWLVTFEKKKV